MASTVLTKENIEKLTELLDYKMTKELLGHQSDAIAYAMAAHPRFVVDPAQSHLDVAHSHSIAGAGGVGGHTHSYSSQAAANTVPARWSETNLYQMLKSRMGWGTSQGDCPFKRVMCMRVTDERVATLIQTNDDAFIIDDGAYLFPSDALITQLRILSE